MKKWTSEVADGMADKQKNMEMVRKYLESRGADGATDQETQYALKMDGNSQRPARGTLVKLGQVIDSGRWRYTPKRRPAIVWVVVNDLADDNENTNTEVPAC